jgi:hypothetical protein
MSTVRRVRCCARERLAFAGVAAFLLCPGCDLGDADVVSRSPDLGPVITSMLGADAANDAIVGPDASSTEPLRIDGGHPVRDAREAQADGPDASLARDSADAVATSRLDAMGGSADGGSAGEAGDKCAERGLVFCDDFEDGAVGWMSTGETWAVTDDLSSSQPNEVFAPAGPAASGAYVAAGQWQEVTVEVRVRVTSFGQATSSNRAEIYARYQDSGHFYAISLRGDGKLGLRRNASSFGLDVGVSVAEKEWHVLKLKVSGPRDAVAVEGYLDGTLLVTATDTNGSLASAVGTVGVGIYGGTMAVFDDVQASSP